MRVCAGAGTVLDAQVGESVRDFGESLIRLPSAVFFLRVPERSDWRKRRAHQDRRRQAVAADAGFEVLRRRGVEVVELEVVFAAPDDLHRLADLLGEQRRFDHVVRLRFAAEAAAEQRYMAGHVGLGDAERIGHGFLNGLGVLRRRPRHDLAVSELRDCRRRFHRGVRQHPGVVRGFMRFRRARERLVDIADVSQRLLRRLHGCEELLAERLRIERGVGAVAPRDVERLPALKRGPAVVGDDRRAAKRLEHVRWLRLGEADYVLHAADFPRRRIVDLRRAAAEHRRTCHCRVDHSRHPGVDPERAFARDEIVEIRDGDGLADERVFRRRLEAQRLGIGHGQRRCSLDELGVRQRSFRCAMDDGVIASRHGLHGHFPARRGCLLEHRPRARAGDAHGVVEVLHRARAVGVLRAVLGVADRLEDPDARPVGVELFGEDHRQAGADAGSHLGAVRDDRHRAVVVENEVDARLPGLSGRLGSDLKDAGGEGVGHAQHQRAGAEAVAEERATGERGAHACLPAASLMAARIR